MSRKTVIQFYKINRFFMQFDDDNYSPIPETNVDETDVPKRRTVDRHKQCRRGGKAFEAGHVKKIVFDPTLLVVKGSVRASMKSQNYKPTAFLNEDYTIKDAKCDCARSVACHHIATLLISAHYNISVTDMSAPGKPSPVMIGMPFNKLFPATKLFSAMDEPGESEVKLICDNMCAGLAWIMQPEPEVCCDIDEPTCPSIPNIQELIASSEFLANSDKFGFLLPKLRMQPSDIVSNAAATIGQISNPLWCEARQCRFSGSKLGAIIAAVAKNRKLAPSLLRSISSQAMLRPAAVNEMKKGKYSDKVNPRQWGEDHEKEAKKK